MTKRSCIVGIIVSLMVSLLSGYSLSVAYGDEHWMASILFVLTGGMVIAFFRFVNDFRYLSGELTQSQLERSRHYQYWFYTHGHKAYEEYRREFGYGGRYSKVRKM